MTKWFFAFVLTAATASAQTKVTVPTNAYMLQWDAPASGGTVASYEIRYNATSAYIGIGIPANLKTSLPNLAPGSYTVQVRACNVVGCSEPASLPIVVMPAAPTMPPASASGLRIIAPTSVAVAPSVAAPMPFFANGWESRDEVGCTWSGIVDALYDVTHAPPKTTTSWDDFGPASACTTTPPEAEIDTVVRHDGQRSLRVLSGVDFRLLKTFSAQAEVTLTAYVRFDDAYEWATGEHKSFAFMNGDVPTVSISHRGTAEPNKARWSVTVGSSVYTDPTTVVTRDVWYRLRVHVNSGLHGSVEAFVTPNGGKETTLALAYESGAQGSLADASIQAITGLKLATASPTAPRPMHRWFDSIALFQGLAP